MLPTFLACSSVAACTQDKDAHLSQAAATTQIHTYTHATIMFMYLCPYSKNSFSIQNHSAPSQLATNHQKEIMATVAIRPKLSPPPPPPRSLSSSCSSIYVLLTYSHTPQLPPLPQFILYRRSTSSSTRPTATSCPSPRPSKRASRLRALKGSSNKSPKRSLRRAGKNACPPTPFA